MADSDRRGHHEIKYMSIAEKKGGGAFCFIILISFPLLFSPVQLSMLSF